MSATHVDSGRHDRHLQSLARRGTVSVIGAGFGSVSGILLTVAITNGFNQALAGTLFAATSAFLILESVVLIGIDTGLVKWVPTYLASGRGGDVWGALAVAIAPMLACSAVVSVATFLLAPTLAPHMVGAEQAEAMAAMIRVFAVLLPVAALSDSLLAATRGLGSMRPTVMYDNLLRQLLQLVAVGLVAFLGGDAVALALAWVAPYGISMALAVVALLRLMRRRAGAPTASTASPGGRTRLAREFWWYTTPRAVARVTQAALKRSDIVLVAALASPAHAAVYAAATRFVVLGQLLVQAVQQALAPHLSRLFARGDLPAARSVFQAATLWSMLGSWPVYLLTAVFASDLLRIFGHDYRTGSDVVVILSLAMLFAVAAGPVDSVLLMAGRSWVSLFNNAVALVVNIGLNLVLIPQYQVTGAAVSWAVAIVLRNVLPLIQVRRSMRMWPATRDSAYAAAAAVLCFGVLGGLAQLAGLPLPAVVAVAAVGGLLYLGGVWAMRERFDLDAFRPALTARRRGRGGQAPPTPVRSEV